MKPERIMIGIPSVGKFSIDLHYFILEAMQRTLAPGARYAFAVQHVGNKRPIEYARNLLVGLFLKSRCDRLWFWDHDTVPDVTAWDLLGYDGDLVAGRYFIWNSPGPNTEPALMLSGYHRPDPERWSWNAVTDPKEIMDVDGAATGCMLIRREVLEDRRMWLGTEYVNMSGEACDLATERADPEWGPPVFRTPRKPNGQEMTTEDLDFCWRAKQLGYSVKFAPGVAVGHVKEVNLDHVGMLMKKVLEAERRSAVEVS